MNAHNFDFAGHTLTALPEGALWIAGLGTLVVSDLHLGKSERIARRSGAILPPYETQETMARLSDLIDRWQPRTVICLGDSFDDLDAAAAVEHEIGAWLARCQAGRRWIWIEGNHDAGPVGFGGTHCSVITLSGLVFRHIAEPGARHELSGHYHPKARLALRGKQVSRPCFVVDRHRVLLPAFGLYTGGLDCRDPAIAQLVGPEARALLTGAQIREIPLPR